MRGLWLLALLIIAILPFSSAHHCNDIPTHLYLKASLHDQDHITRSLNVHTHTTGEIRLTSQMEGLSIDPQNLSITIDEELPVNVTFNGSLVGPGAYVGLIEVAGEERDYAISVVFEVESEYRTYDLNLDIPPLYTTVSPEQKLLYQATIFNLFLDGQLTPFPTELETEFRIYAPDGRILQSEEETIIVTDTARITKSVTLPESVDCDEYILAGIVRDKRTGSVGVATQSFRVSLPPATLKERLASVSLSDFLIIFLLTVLIFIVVLIGIHMKKEHSSIKKKAQKFKYGSS